MSVLVPPVRLACTANKLRIDYILNLANQKDFEFTPVSIKRLCHPITPRFCFRESVCTISIFLAGHAQDLFSYEKHDILKRPIKFKGKNGNEVCERSMYIKKKWCS